MASEIKWKNALVRTGFMILVTLIIMMVDYRYCRQGRAIVWGIKGSYDVVETIRIGEWLVIILPVLFCSAMRMDNYRRMAALLLPRYRSVSKCWRNLWQEIVLDIGVYATCLTVVAGISGKREENGFLLLFLLFFYFMLLSSFFLFLSSMGVPLLGAMAAILLFVGMGLLAGRFFRQHIRYNILFWGMYEFSELKYGNGFQVSSVLMAEVCMVLGVTCLLKRRFLNYLVR